MKKSKSTSTRRGTANPGAESFTVRRKRKGTISRQIPQEAESQGSTTTTKIPQGYLQGSIVPDDATEVDNPSGAHPPK